MGHFIMLSDIKYRLLKIEYFLRMNFGFDDFGLQLLSLHVVKKSPKKNEYVLSRYYDTSDIWSLGSYFLILE
jgi:hypothetical protein